MINSHLLTDKLAEEVAWQYLNDLCAGKAFSIFTEKLSIEISDELLNYRLINKNSEEDDKKLTHDILFNALFKAINPYEKKFKAMLKRVWDEEKRILIANIKKMKKAWLTKGKVDDILYPTAIFEKKLATGASTIIIEVMEKEGPRVVSLYDFDMMFDVDSPEVQKWLKSYVPKFSKNLEEVNVRKLRATLVEGIEAGEGVPELTRRVYETYDGWGFKRAETIAQNQVIRASNKAALNVYRQSGVVKKKIWITHFDKRTCFPGNVKIITNKGKRKIRTIKKGDVVLTHDGWQKVKETMNREYYGNMVKIKTSDRRKLVATEDHPIYVINKSWVEAKKLTMVSKLQTYENKTVKIVSIQNIKFFNSYIVYNLEVENAHTFFANGILVHNCPHCEMMDGRIIGLEENFWDLGDESTIKVDGKDNTLKFNYEEIESPPAHTQCRCAMGAIVD